MKKIGKATVRPAHGLELLSHREINDVMESDEELFRVFRDCALAVLNTGSERDDVAEIFADYADFEACVVPESRGIKLEVYNAPASAFVDGRMIRGIRDHLFAALRDIVYTGHKINLPGRFDLATGEGLTDTVFRILRNAGIVQASRYPNLVVCWGGHSIDRLEYDYSKEVGYQMGLRGMDVATGCGVGAMKGPMKGALIGHAKQQIRDGRYMGITEPGIIASESPNPTVNELVILPDIEKRLEAFVRVSHTLVIFPGGAGTVEEVLYLLGILMHPANRNVPVPVIFAAPEGREEYFKTLDNFIRGTLGEDAGRFYRIVIGEPERVARLAREGIDEVIRYRRRTQESYAFNWKTHVPEGMQRPFLPVHENMADLHLDPRLPPHELAAQLRRAFSGIVAGNVKAFGIEQVKARGPYLLHGDRQLMKNLDGLLKEFVQQGRMRLKEEEYEPCYQLIESPRSTVNSG